MAAAKLDGGFTVPLDEARVDVRIGGVRAERSIQLCDKTCIELRGLHRRSLAAGSDSQRVDFHSHAGRGPLELGKRGAERARVGGAQ